MAEMWEITDSRRRINDRTRDNDSSENSDSPQELDELLDRALLLQHNPVTWQVVETQDNDSSQDNASSYGMYEVLNRHELHHYSPISRLFLEHSNREDRTQNNLPVIHLTRDNDSSYDVTEDPSFRQLLLDSLARIRAGGLNDTIPNQESESIPKISTRTYHPSSNEDKVNCHKIASVNENCQICLTEFADGDVLGTLPCLHEFHSCCINQWLEVRLTCPYCRGAVTS